MEKHHAQRRIFVTGGTGYLGQRLIPALLARGHEVRALVRPGSERRLPPGCEPVLGNALDAASYAPRVGNTSEFQSKAELGQPWPGSLARARPARREPAPRGESAAP